MWQACLPRRSSAKADRQHMANLQPTRLPLQIKRMEQNDEAQMTNEVRAVACAACSRKLRRAQRIGYGVFARKSAEDSPESFRGYSPYARRIEGGTRCPLVRRRSLWRPKAAQRVGENIIVFEEADPLCRRS